MKLHLAAAAALALAATSQAPVLAKETSTMTANPLATQDQTDVTARALRLLEMPEVQRAREITAMRWKLVLRDDPPPRAWDTFDEMIDELMFNYALKAANGDPNYPRIVHIHTLPHKRKGMDVPGSRWGGDNPDNIYRMIPIDSKAHYRLDGKRSDNPPSNVTYQLVSTWEGNKTLTLLEGADMTYGPDGSFSITLDPEPANGRPNHIQTKPGSLWLFVRDSLGDWSQVANTLAVHRLDPPDAPPMTDQQAAERVADIAPYGVYPAYWYLTAWNRSNTIANFRESGPLGGIPSQRSSQIMLKDLKDDEAFVLTMDPANAPYYSVVTHDDWFISIDYANITSCLNKGQVVKNADGSITYVVSARDPGVHNWINTDGVADARILVRLQGLPEKPTKQPWIRSQLVRLDELKAVLPKDTKWVTPEERAAQIAQRQRQIAARMADH